MVAASQSAAAESLQFRRSSRIMGQGAIVLLQLAAEICTLAVLSQHPAKILKVLAEAGETVLPKSIKRNINNFL